MHAHKVQDCACTHCHVQHIQLTKVHGMHLHTFTSTPGSLHPSHSAHVNLHAHIITAMYEHGHTDMNSTHAVWHVWPTPYAPTLLHTNANGFRLTNTHTHTHTWHLCMHSIAITTPTLTCVLICAQPHSHYGCTLSHQVPCMPSMMCYTPMRMCGHAPYTYTYVQWMPPTPVSCSIQCLGDTLQFYNGVPLPHTSHCTLLHTCSVNLWGCYTCPMHCCLQVKTCFRAFQATWPKTWCSGWMGTMQWGHHILEGGVMSGNDPLFPIFPLFSPLSLSSLLLFCFLLLLLFLVLVPLHSHSVP